MKKTKKWVIGFLIAIIVIVALSVGIYIDKIYVAMFVGAAVLAIIECIIGYFLEYQYEETPSELKQKINKAIYSLENDKDLENALYILKEVEK